MTYYIVSTGIENDYTIMKVKDEDDAEFWESHPDSILAQGQTIQEALEEFHMKIDLIKAALRKK